MELTVQEIWRYPVKSMQGEKLQSCVLTARGIPYDRGWAVRDEKTRTIRGAKHLPQLMLCSAKYVEPHTMAGAVPHVEIRLPDGSAIRSDDSLVHDALSAVVGRHVTLWPLVPAKDKDHYQVRDEEALDPVAEWRRIFMLEPNEPMPDLSGFGSALLRELSTYVAPLGTYFDAFPVNVLTDASLKHLARLIPSAQLDVRRFRPNFLLAGGAAADGPIEEAWVNHGVALGSAQLKIASKAPRCVMTSHAQPKLAQDREIIRTIVTQLQSCLSVYANVEVPGLVRVGDSASVIGGPP